MSDEVEQLAEAIHQRNPVTINGVAFDWAEVVRVHPGRAVIYREAARNRLRADEAMKKLASDPTKARPWSAS